MRFGQGLGKKRVTKGTVLRWLEKDGCPEKVIGVFKEFIEGIPENQFETSGPQVGYKVHMESFDPTDKHIEGLFFDFCELRGSFVEIDSNGCIVHFGKTGINCTPLEAAEKFTFFINEIQKMYYGKSRKRSKKS